MASWHDEATEGVKKGKATASPSLDVVKLDFFSDFARIPNHQIELRGQPPRAGPKRARMGHDLLSSVKRPHARRPPILTITDSAMLFYHGRAPGENLTLERVLRMGLPRSRPAEFGETNAPAQPP